MLPSNGGRKATVCLIACSLLFVCAVTTARGAEECTDIPPPGSDLTCEQQAALGKCDRSWMEGYCLKSCGICEEDSESEAEDKEPAETEPAIASTPLPSADCVDVLPPDSDFTCEEQADYGKCDAEWMIEGGYCALTCGRCTPLESEQAEEEAAEVQGEEEVVEENLEEVETEEEEAPVPAAERVRNELTEIAEALGSDDVNDDLVIQPVVLPGINLDEPRGESRQPATPAPRVTRPAPARPTPARPTPAKPTPAKPTPKPETTLSEETEERVREVVAELEAAPMEEPSSTPLAATDLSEDCDPDGPTAYSILMDDEELSTLRQAVDVLNLAGVMQNPDVDFTLLAPTNAAFKRAATSLGLTLNQLLSSRNSLRDVVFTHIVPNEIITAEDIASAGFLRPEAATTIFVDDGFGGLKLISVGSSASVVEPDYQSGCNYVIHKIDGVLLPNPTPTNGINPAYQRALTRGAAGK